MNVNYSCTYCRVWWQDRQGPHWATRQLAGSCLYHLGVAWFSASSLTSQRLRSLMYKMGISWKAIVQLTYKVSLHTVGIQIRTAITMIIKWQVSHPLKSLSKFWKRGNPLRRRLSFKGAAHSLIIYFLMKKCLQKLQAWLMQRMSVVYLKKHIAWIYNPLKAASSSVFSTDVRCSQLQDTI